MQVFADALLERLEWCGGNALERTIRGGYIGKVSLGNLAYAAIRDVAHCRKDHLVGGMCAMDETFDALRVVVFECGLAT